ncbi:MAG: MBL fold metallo-hydrolase [bacterium]
MRLTILGSGTCVPSLTRNASGYHLSVSDRHILVDCGGGTLLQLERTGISYQVIDAVFITHLHPDHVSDLIPFIQALVATPGLVRTKDLLIAGPEGIRRFMESCVFGLLQRPKTFACEIVEMEDRLSLGDTLVLATRTLHSENSLAYRFETGETSVVFTGDCDYDQNLASFSAGADLLIIDCSFPDAMKVRGHLVPRECGLIAKKAGIRRLILSHIYPTSFPDDIRIEECRRVYDGDVMLAEDLMAVDIP